MLVCDGSAPDAEVRHMIDESYRLVFEGLPKEIRSEITLKSGENYEYEISFGRKKYWFTHKTTNPQGFDNLED